MTHTQTLSLTHKFKCTHLQTTHTNTQVRLSYILRENTYPFLALIFLKQGRMVVCERIEGTILLDDLVTRLQNAITDHEGELVVERNERMRRSESQLLRKAQDQAYQESLAADKEKERLKAEEHLRRVSQVQEDEEKEREQQRKEEVCTHALGNSNE